MIARVGEPGEEPSGDGAAAKPKKQKTSKKPSAEAEETAAASAAPATAAPPAAAPADADGRVKASPLARRIARERGLDLAGLAGSGPGGRIVKADVEKAIAAGPTPAAAQAAAPPAAAPAGPTPGAAERPETAKGSTSFEELTKLQSTVARRMAESKATAPHFYL